ncbi:unnamed protein product [Arabis nemorensis]|uniref:DUF4283 domain-containing protein n=1 Tax=Arabis nemorensis TaxID=586526 RepID=A0A565CDK9_9BRAS|nr:unnamed protein product [Arabis nemorensis]
MAFFGKLVAPDQEKKRSKPLQLLPVNNTQILQRFEKTLVGRVLNLEAQENKVKAVIGFLPTIWKCEGRVQGVEMGRGRFHFRFKEEADLQAVLDNRPYHFDGWMNAIERWVPTVRMDFPSSIPFWIRILDLPEIYNEEKQLVRIGEDLGELLNWKVMEPYPMIQVMVECDAPLILFWEIVSETEELFRIRFDYVKLQNHCKVCFRMSHDTRTCPTWVGTHQSHRDSQREPIRRREDGGDRRGRKAPQGEIAQPLRIGSILRLHWRKSGRTLVGIGKGQRCQSFVRWWWLRRRRRDSSGEQRSRRASEFLVRASEGQGDPDGSGEHF